MKNIKKIQFKLVENGKPISYIERKYGINRRLIYIWKNKYGTITTSTGEVTTNDEILKLKKELNEIKIENEILKKAITIFTKKQKIKLNLLIQKKNTELNYQMNLKIELLI